MGCTYLRINDSFIIDGNSKLHLCHPKSDHHNHRNNRDSEGENILRLCILSVYINILI